MSRLRDVVRRLIRPSGRRRPAPTELAEASPGRYGPHATTQTRDFGAVRTSYNPHVDGDPDPGEIVWTWVPFEENDGRGKDRPVLVVAREPAGTLLAVQLSSRPHDDVEWIPIGSGPWDNEGRASWVDVSRVLRVRPDGMRREAAALDREPFDSVIAALRQRHGWR